MSLISDLQKSPRKLKRAKKNEKKRLMYEYEYMNLA